MKKFSKIQTNGKVLCVFKHSIYKSIQNKLYVSNDKGENWDLIFKISSNNFIKKIAYNSHLLCRLFRLGIHHINFFDDQSIAVLYDKNISLFNNYKLNKPISIKGSRPLSFENINNKIYFGEYRSNPERSEISLFTFDKINITSNLKISNIRHIHGIYQDPYTGKVWITTGDENQESCIYCAENDFSNLELVLTGSQQTRAIKLLFDEHCVFFGSDAPHEINHIYKLTKDTKKVSKLIQVGSSIFHGTKVKNWMFFSTAVEPSKINKTKKVEIWASPNGNEWKCILKFKKDIFSMRYFQYGQAFFPVSNLDDSLWISLFATKGSNKSFAISLDKIEKLFYNS